MCTVIYIPTANGVLFSSCRDENPARARALQPVLAQSTSGNILFPTDAEKGGTWIGLHERGHLLVLLNGAFEAHQRIEKYKTSRGLIVKDLLDKEYPLKEWHSCNLHNTEPFTLILWQKDKLYELVWDGTVKYTLRRNTSLPQIWSSSTLYNHPVKQERKGWFDNWFARTLHPSTENVYQMLLQHNDNKNGFVMNRQTIQTLSISLIEIRGNHGRFHYHDMVAGSKHTAALTLNIKHETAY